MQRYYSRALASVSARATPLELHAVTPRTPTPARDRNADLLARLDRAIRSASGDRLHHLVFALSARVSEGAARVLLGNESGSGHKEEKNLSVGEAA